MTDPAFRRRCYDCPECHVAEFGVRRCFFLSGRYSRRFRQHQPALFEEDAR